MFMGSFQSEFSNANIADLVKQTVSLLNGVFNSRFSEVKIYQDQPQSSSRTNAHSVVKILFDDADQAIGEFVIKDVKADGLEAQGHAILDIIAVNFINQFKLVNDYSDLKQELAETNRELVAHRNELEVLYEDLNMAHEELSQAFTTTFELGKSLSRSKTKINGLLEKAPIAFGVLRHRQLKIEIANNLILELWGKDKTVLGKPLSDGLPELEGQPYLEILDRVYTTGERYIGQEAKATLQKEGRIADYYFNFIYEPIKNEQGTTNSIMIIATDVSDLVKSRNELLQN